MDDSEVALLLAVHAALLDYMQLAPHEIDIEADEMAPASIGDRYLAVIPGGYTTGQIHDANGSTREEIHSIDVAVVVRIPEYAKDRQREAFLENARSMAPLIQGVRETIDFEYNVNQAANAILQRDYGIAAGEGFIEPLKVKGLGRIATVPGAFFDGNPDERRAGFSRRVFLRGAKFMSTRRIAS